MRAGYFKDVDVTLFSHVASNFNAPWGESLGSGLVSVEYLFKGESAHSAGAPWRGRSALDAVELMDTGWNFRREHLRLQQRSHYVITDGGDQPNVVPPTAAVWYYFRELDYPHIKGLWEIGDKMAQGAVMMTDTSFTSRVLGAAWPVHMNKPIAEAMYANIKQVGLPEWSQDDQTLAKALQKELKVKEEGLATKIEEQKPPPKEEERMGGGSDDIGDISWNVPTVTLWFPSNIPNLPGHNWSDAIAMATPIAHKGAVAGAKVQAMTMLDLLLHQELVRQAWDYFKNVQTKDIKYTPLLRPEDKPAIWLNEKTNGDLSTTDESLLLRLQEVQNVSGAIGDQVPYCAHAVGKPEACPTKLPRASPRPAGNPPAGKPAPEWSPWAAAVRWSRSCFHPLEINSEHHARGSIYSPRWSSDRCPCGSFPSGAAST